MKKNVFLKIIAMVVLNVFIISMGMTTFAAVRTPIMPRWSYITSCGYVFDVEEENADYDVFVCGGDITVDMNLYGYVKVVLQYYKDGTWKTFDSWEEQGFMGTIVEEFVEVTPGYTYRIHVTYKALNANGSVLETFSEYSEYNLVSLPRN